MEDIEEEEGERKRQRIGGEEGKAKGEEERQGDGGNEVGEVGFFITRDDITV